MVVMCTAKSVSVGSLLFLIFWAAFTNWCYRDPLPGQLLRMQTEIQFPFIKLYSDRQLMLKNIVVYSLTEKLKVGYS
ncbi:unnamed protein product [Trichobilharzia szidati]|nr:unnamed protein product [Trichobilharzia szidati]